MSATMVSQCGCVSTRSMIADVETGDVMIMSVTPCFKHARKAQPELRALQKKLAEIVKEETATSQKPTQA